MRRHGVLLFFFALLGSGLHAFDYGLNALDSTVFVSDSLTLTQQNRATLWFSLPLDPSARLHLSGFYEFRGSFSDSGSSLVPWRFDLGRSEYSGSLAGILGSSSVLRWYLGRTSTSDFSGWILSGLYDGGRVELANGNATYSLSLLYTGLLNKDDALLGMDSHDQVIAADTARYFAPRRLLSSIAARFTEALPGQDVGAEIWGEIDLERGSAGTQGLYLEPYVEGRFGRSLSWRTWAAGEILFGVSQQKALAAGALARLSLPDLLNLRATASLAWSSGSSSGLSPFVPLRQGTLDALTGFTFSNILSASSDLALSPLSWFSSTLRGAALFRTSELVIGSTEVRSDATSRFLGSEFSLQLSFRLATDLSLRGLAGVFLPNTEDYFKAEVQPRFTASAYAELSL